MMFIDEEHKKKHGITRENGKIERERESFSFWWKEKAKNRIISYGFIWDFSPFFIRNGNVDAVCTRLLIFLFLFSFDNGRDESFSHAETAMQTSRKLYGNF